MTDVKKATELLNTECGFQTGVDEDLFCGIDDGIVQKIKTATGETEYEKVAEKLECSDISCVIDHPKVGLSTKEKKFAFTFLKPEGPFDSTEWLSNFNIDDNLEQYEKAFSGFKHVTFQMSDFMEKNTDLSQISLRNLKNSHMTMGCVLNTDVSTGSGIHWFCIFCDKLNTSAPTIEYFNSSAEPPKKDIVKWIDREKKDSNAQYIKVLTKQQQWSDTECGVYCLYFIFRRLCGTPVSWFQNNTIRDDQMKKFRRYVFRRV